MTVIELGPVLRSLREGAGLTQRVLGEQADIPGNVVGELENGSPLRDPATYLPRLAKVLGDDVLMLLRFWAVSELTRAEGNLREVRALALAADLGQFIERMKQEIGPAIARGQAEIAKLSGEG